MDLSAKWGRRESVAPLPAWEVGHNLGMTARASALAGVVLSAVLMVALGRPAMREIIGWYGQPWLGVVILGVPVVALLTVSGCRFYGPGRSFAVAVIVVVLSGVASAVCGVLAVGAVPAVTATEMSSGSQLLVWAAVQCAPFVLVLALGMFAIEFARAKYSAAETPSALAAEAFSVLFYRLVSHPRSASERLRPPSRDERHSIRGGLRDSRCGDCSTRARG